MTKKVAVIAFNPVNGMGLFQYLETFFENDIEYKTFSIANTREIKTNSGISLMLDATVFELAGSESEYDALVFACGDAMLKFGKILDTDYIQKMFEIIVRFNEQGKIIVGHCAAAAIFDKVGITSNKKLAVHPFGKAAIEKGIATDSNFIVDGNMYTAQTENTIVELLPHLLKVLK